MANGFNNPWYTQVDEVTPEYIPIPMEALFQAGQQIQGRADQAYEQLGQFQTGLSSMEAYAPEHIKYRDRIAEQFRQETSDLLDQYNNRASDPQFLREMRRIQNRYASDPNLTTISTANQLYKDRMASIKKISEDGGRYLDSNPGFTGIDEYGNLTADVGSITRTTFEKDLTDAFKEAAKARFGDGTQTTNEAALLSTVESFMTGRDPIVQEALTYFMQQGASPEEATLQLATMLDRLAQSSRTWLYDDTRERLGIAQANLRLSAAKFELAREKHGWEKEDRFADMMSRNLLIPHDDAIAAKDINKGTVAEINRALKTVESKANHFTVPDTEENRLKYPEGERITSANLGSREPDRTISLIQVPTAVYGEDPRKREIVKEARGIVQGADSLSDHQVLEKYKNLLQAGNPIVTFTNSGDSRVRKNLADLYGTNFDNSYVVLDGAKPKLLTGSKSDFKNISYEGSSFAPMEFDGTGFENGSMKFTATDDKGNRVTIYKPIDAQDPLAILNQTGNIIAKAQMSGMSNEALRSHPSMAIVRESRTQPGVIRALYPQKKENRGRIEVVLREFDPNGNIINEVDPTDILREESQRTLEYQSTLHK